jgi:hypothetical protein
MYHWCGMANFILTYLYCYDIISYGFFSSRSLIVHIERGPLTMHDHIGADIKRGARKQKING